MKIFSTHRRKLEPHRRFGTRSFQNKIRAAANYKRVFNPTQRSWRDVLWTHVSLASKFWRALATIVVLVVIYYIWLSPRFVVRNVEVTGNVQVAAQDISDAITKHRILFLTTGRADRILTQAIPTVKQITSYQRVWPNTIKLRIEERVPGFVIESNRHDFLIDDEGTVVSQVA